jgi:4-aminobutyrate aminotransferase
MNEHWNEAEEERCLEEVRKTIQSKGHWGDCGAIVVEPISSIKNQMATPRFFKSLRKLAQEHMISFIVDETKTGLGATGKNWGYEHWFLHDD